MKVFRSSDDANELIPLLSSKHCFVKFHADWCGHCKAMQKDWNEMLKSFEADTYLEMHEYTGDDEVIIAEINSNNMSKLPADIKSAVRGFPTILELQHGRIINEYKGDRSHNDLYIWILINTDPKEKTAPQPRAPPPQSPQPRAQQVKRSPPMPAPAPQPQVIPAPQPQVRPAPQPQVIPAPQPQVRPAPQPQVIPAPQPQVRPAPQPQVRPAPQPQVRPAPQPPQKQTMQQRFSMVGNQFYW